MTNHLGHHAVVIGGSLAGLMTARVLADHFNQVTILERDYIDGQPTVHKSIPQGNHPHGLLPSGQRILASLYPDLFERLEKLGAMRCRMGTEQGFYLPDGKAYSLTGAVREPRDLGFDFYLQSRGLLEHCVRQCTIALASVKSEKGLLTLSDPLCSFNPVYAQGMSVAALGVKLLQSMLAERVTAGQGLEGVARTFFVKAAEIIATPWTMAGNSDFLYPQTKGERPADLKESLRYFAALDALTGEDVEVQRVVIEVFHLTKPLSVLQEEPLRSRIIAQQRKQTL